MADKRKKNWYRPWFQAAFFALTNGYANGFLKGKIYTGNTKALCVPGLNCYSCPGAFGSCPIGSLQAVLDSQKFSMSCYVFGFLMAFGALFGRLVCGWMCPFGLLQDMLHKIPVFKKRKNLPGHEYLRYLKYVILVLFVIILPSVVVNVAGMGKPWFCEYICPSGTLLGGIPLVSLNKGLRDATGLLFAWKVAILLLVIVLSMKFFRPFCKYVCPLGAIYGLFNPISFYRFRVDEDSCTKCGACQNACKMDIKVWEQPNSMECIRCGDCKAVCPQHAITSTLEAAVNRTDSRYVRNDPADEVRDQGISKAFLAVITIIVSAIILYYDFVWMRTDIMYSVLMGGKENILPSIAWFVALTAAVSGLFAGGYLFYYHRQNIKLTVLPQVSWIIWILLILSLITCLISGNIIDDMMLIVCNIGLVIVAFLLQALGNKCRTKTEKKKG